VSITLKDLRFSQQVKCFASRPSALRMIPRRVNRTSL